MRKWILIYLFRKQSLVKIMLLRSKISTVFCFLFFVLNSLNLCGRVTDNRDSMTG